MTAKAMNPTEFIAALRKGKTAVAYFLRGPDRFLHEECRRAVVSSLPADAREWCLTQIEFEPGRLSRALEGADQMPMLGGHSFFIISDPEDFKHATDEDFEALDAYLDRPSSFATVVFAAVEPDRRRRLIQLLEKKAEVVELRPLAVRDAAVWAKDFLGQAGVDLEAELAEEIAGKFEIKHDRDPERSGVNLLAMRTEIEKLLTARPEVKRVERADLDLIVAFREERQIGGFLQALAERNCGAALECLRALLAARTAEMLLLWSIGDLFRQALRSQATTAGDAGRGGWGRPGSAWSNSIFAAQALRNYSRQELLQAIRLARRTDLGIKSSWKDSRVLLEFLVWEIIAGKGTGELGVVEPPRLALESA